MGAGEGQDVWGLLNCGVLLLLLSFRGVRDETVNLGNDASSKLLGICGDRVDGMHLEIVMWGKLPARKNIGPMSYRRGFIQ